MTNHTAKVTARGLAVAAMAWMLTLAAGMPAGAAIAIDQTIKVPGPTPHGIVNVDGQEVRIPGARDITIRIQATQALADPATVGPSGLPNAPCSLVDRRIGLKLDAGASGSVTVTYTTLDGAGGAVTDDEVVPFASPAAQEKFVAICLNG